MKTLGSQRFNDASTKLIVELLTGVSHVSSPHQTRSLPIFVAFTITFRVISA